MSWTKEQQRECDRQRWQATKADPAKHAAYRTRTNAAIAARKVADPEWYERYKARLREYHQENKAKHVAKVREWRHKHPGLRSGEHRKGRYRLSRDDYNRMVAEQKGLCAICSKPPRGKSPMGVLHVDHDHATDVVRALLCDRCNKGLGCFKDEPALLWKAAMYLAQHKKLASVS